MSYDEEEAVKELNFRIDDDGDDTEPAELPLDDDEFKFDEEESEIDDPDDKYH
jgi:hypothetical protein